MISTKLAILFCKKTVEIDEDAVCSWFDAKKALRIEPLKEQIDDFDITNYLADALFFIGYDVEDALIIIDAKETGFLFAKNTGIFDYYFYIDSEEKLKEIKEWNNERDLKKFIDNIGYKK